MSVYENDLLNSETYKKQDCCFEKYLIISSLQRCIATKEFSKKGGRGGGGGEEKEKARLPIKEMDFG
jgi:hypothetical protein